MLKKLNDIQHLIEIISSILQTPEIRVDAETNFSHLSNWDSLCWLKLDLELRERTDFKLLIENIDLINTVQDLQKVMENE